MTIIHSKRKSTSFIRMDAGRIKNLWRNNLALFLALVTIIFIMPVIPGKDLIITKVLLAMIVVSGLYAAEFGPRIFRVLFALGSSVLIISLAEVFLRNDEFLKVLSFLVHLVFFVIVTFALIAHVARARKVDRATILCAINSYLLVGVSASVIFIMLDIIQPESFTQIDVASESYSAYIYFGFVTLSTLGYGDIAPSSPPARSFATFTALLGQLYLVTVMALIIGKYLNSKPEDLD